jgi:DNA-binding XRE family transcriptional regulator
VVSKERKKYPQIGWRLICIRKGLSELNQADWAEKHGFARSQYNQWERGSRRIPVECAVKLCDRYGLTLDAIYRGRLDGLSEKLQKMFS